MTLRVVAMLLGEGKTRMSRVLAALGIAVALIAVQPLAAPTAQAATTWTTAWGSAMQEASPFSGRNFTCRSIARVTLGGSQIRVRLSNVFVTTPTTFTHVTVARRDQGGAIVAGTTHDVGFGGSTSVTLAAGTQAIGDPVSMPVSAGDDLAVSMYLAGAPTSFDNHEIGSVTLYCSDFGGSAGDHTGDVGAQAFGNQSANVPWVSGIDVAGASGAGAVVALGDSITDGYDSTVNGFATWPNALSRRLIAAGSPLSVVNEGISGNKIIAAGGAGPSAVQRFDRDVLGVSNARVVVVMEGTNDLSQGASAADVIGGLTQLANAAHSHGLRIIAGTIPPRDGCCGSDETRIDAALAQINGFIRTDSHFDGVVDFDAALRDPAAPGRINPPYDAGDHLHPGDAGYAAMADAVDLAGLSENLPPGPYLPTGYTLCAGESGTCTVAGTATVAYGAAKYTYRTVTSSIACTSAAFGLDPAYGLIKSCYVAPAGGPSGYTACAADNGTCSFSGPEKVAYGADGAFVYRLASGGVSCDSVTFGGDPAPGRVKQCYLPPAGAPSGGWTRCAAEAATCSLLLGQPVAYGAGGAFSYSTATSGMRCDNTTFGDPIPNLVKACYTVSGSPPGFARSCAAENSTCAITTPRTVAYGGAGKFVYRSFNASTPCSNAAFGQDPLPGLVKACYLTS